MSSYRDDHNAAVLRIETLEAKLRERDAALVTREAEIAEKDAEIARLKQSASSPDAGSDPPSAGGPARALTAFMGLGFAVVFLAVASGYVRMAGHSRCRFDRPRWHGPPAAQMVVAAPGAVPRPAAPHKVEVAPPPADAAEVQEAQPSDVADERSMEVALREKLEAKVWAGAGSKDEIRLLKAICSHMRDRSCSDRASVMLK